VEGYAPGVAVASMDYAVDVLVDNGDPPRQPANCRRVAERLGAGAWQARTPPPFDAERRTWG
jgi:hypothetical protein